jgi:hypothetical protein
MAFKTSLDKSNNRYVQGGTTALSNNRLGWWERLSLGRDINETYFTVTGKYCVRPDLISYDQYGNEEYAWLVLQYNNIVDLNEELTNGATIKLPSMSYVLQNILPRSTQNRAKYLFV